MAPGRHGVTQGFLVPDRNFLVFGNNNRFRPACSFYSSDVIPLRSSSFSSPPPFCFRVILCSFGSVGCFPLSGFCVLSHQLLRDFDDAVIGDIFLGGLF